MLTHFGLLNLQDGRPCSSCEESSLWPNGSVLRPSLGKESLLRAPQGLLGQLFLWYQCRQRAVRRLCFLLSELPTVDASAEDLHLIRMGSLQRAVSAFSCCSSPLTVTEDRNSRRGLVPKLSISCSVCGKSSAITDPYSKKDLEVNSKSVLAMRVVGKGRGALETCSGLMGMLPPISQPAYSSHKKLLVVSQKEREASCSAAVAEVRKDVPEDDIVDITVTFFKATTYQ